MSEALGMIETRGVAAMEAADAMVKAANVAIISRRGGGRRPGRRLRPRRRGGEGGHRGGVRDRVDGRGVGASMASSRGPHDELGKHFAGAAA